MKTDGFVPSLTFIVFTDGEPDKHRVQARPLMDETFGLLAVKIRLSLLQQDFFEYQLQTVEKRRQAVELQQSYLYQSDRTDSNQSHPPTLRTESQDDCS